MAGGAGAVAALIIAGGRGTRFWPEGRINRPKPLFALDGKTTLLTATIRRLQPLIPRERIFVLVAAKQTPLFRRELREVLPRRNLLVEPMERGTAVAIAFGSSVIARRLGNDPVIAVTPADHHIPQADKFRKTISKAVKIASREQAIVVVGIKPTRPETGYGYQEIGPALATGYRVVRFIEKPKLDRARRMIRSDKFLWNGGIFVMRARTLRRELTQHAPPLANALDSLSIEKGERLRGLYTSLPSGAFDRVVAEKSHNLIGVRAGFRWDDVGSWEGLWEALRRNAHSVESGNVVMLDSHGVLARGGKRLMVLLGVSDLIAVDTDDAVLIMRRSHSQKLGRALEELQRRGLQKYM